jgi:hypothetical protein
VSTVTRRAIYGKLTGDTTLTAMLGAAATGYTKAIYHEVAPQGAVYPLVIMNKQAGTPTYAATIFTTPRSSVNDPLSTLEEQEIWLIKAIDHNTTANAAEAISARVTALLEDVTLLSPPSRTQRYLRRDADVEYAEVADGEVYRHVGSLFCLVTS